LSAFFPAQKEFSMPITKDLRYRKAFLLALGMAFLLFLPFIVYDGGYFIYYGDFNVQQIPFYKLAHEAVRSGNIFWSFYTDLGASFIGSYSFYLLFSPFFWLTLPFPTSWLPLMMAPLLMLKTACAALTAYLYLERFVRDRDFALLGSILYAFSGWMFFNIFFNHFHDVAVFFPLLLLGVEKLVTEQKRGFFALMVAVNAMVNYWFFVGEVVFVVLYVFVRMTDKDWGMNFKSFCFLTLEAVMGVGLSAAVLLPSVLALLGNPRTGTDNLLTGWNVWIYWQNQNREAILHSLFFPPEWPARLNFFPDAGGAWSSRSAWLPLVGASGTLAYFFSRKNDWLKKMLGLCLLTALVPGLNSLFILLNHSYYARWFYMPILLMALVTARALEESAADNSYMLRGLKWSLIASVVFIVMCGLTPQIKEDKLIFGLESNPKMLWIYAVVVLTCLLYMTLLIARLRSHQRFKTMLLAGVCVVCLSFGIFYLANGKNSRTQSQFIIQNAIHGREIISLPDDGESFSRIDFYDSLDNMGMYWHRPTIQAFHSIVPPSVMEFYPTVGVKRDVGSRPEADFFALRPLLSVRWLFIESNKPNQDPMPGYTFHSEQLGFHVYENQNFLPMGYAYSQYILREQLEEINEKQRSNLMLRYLVVENEEAAARYSDLMSPGELIRPIDTSYDAMANDVADRLEMSCYHFSHDNRGFTARSNLEQDTLMFFSVPYDGGWTATVNGSPVPIEKVNVGFMGVRVPAGEAVIRFDYLTPGLGEGLWISGGFLLLLGLYFLWCRKGDREKSRALDIQRSLFLGEAVHLTWEEYLTRYRNKQARQNALNRALEQAGITEEEFRFLPEDSPPEKAEGSQGSTPS
jgi:uncharacterized membrane protein YfhO